jgi:hypothetical protein
MEAYVFHDPQQQRYNVDLPTRDFDLWPIHATNCTTVVSSFFSLCANRQL